MAWNVFRMIQPQYCYGIPISSLNPENYKQCAGDAQLFKDAETPSKTKPSSTRLSKNWATISL